MEMSLLTFKTSVKMATFFLYNWNHSQYKNTNLCTYSAVKKDLLPYIFLIIKMMIIIVYLGSNPT